MIPRSLLGSIGDYIQESDNVLSAPAYDVDRIRQILQHNTR